MHPLKRSNSDPLPTMISRLNTNTASSNLSRRHTIADTVSNLASSLIKSRPVAGNRNLGLGTHGQYTESAGAHQNRFGSSTSGSTNSLPDEDELADLLHPPPSPGAVSVQGMNYLAESSLSSINYDAAHISHDLSQSNFAYHVTDAYRVDNQQPGAHTQVQQPCAVAIEVHSTVLQQVQAVVQINVHPIQPHSDVLKACCIIL